MSVLTLLLVILNDPEFFVSCLSTLIELTQSFYGSNINYVIKNSTQLHKIIEPVAPVD